MKQMFKTLVMVSMLAVLAGCASRGDVSGVADQDMYPQDGYAYPGYETPDAYATAPAGRPDGRVVGGPAASTQERVVYFDFDSAEVRSDSRAVIDAHVRYLRQNLGTSVILEGHADERGTREYNIGLGERRGESVRRLMIASGVSPQQIRMVSYGEERPAVAGQDEESYSQNRRVEIVYN